MDNGTSVTARRTRPNGGLLNAPQRPRRRRRLWAMATVSGSEPVSANTPNAYTRLLRRIEEAATLDRVVDQVDPLAGKLTSNDRMRGVLHGDVTGIPLHAILTDLPLGAWWMSTFLDPVSYTHLTLPTNREV